MRVVMVGHGGVGKTTFMSSMYRDMATSGVHGFWVRAQTDAEHRRLLAAAEGVARSRYPPPSDQRKRYGLTLRYGRHPLIEFTWSDYRGGVLREARSAQSTEFLEDALTADAVLVFVDSSDLIGRRTVARARIRDLTNVVFQIIDGRETLVPVVLVITKSDLLSDQLPLAELQGFIDAMQGDERIVGTVVPIVCGPQPQNILVPVMFSLYFGVRSRAERLYGEAKAAREIAEALRQERTGKDWLVSRLTGQKTNGELARIVDGHADRELRSLQPLVAPVMELEDMLAEIPVF